jgi:hypothetical protein
VATYRQLTDRVLQALQGDALDQTQQTALTEDLTEDGLTLALDDAAQISSGLVEIDGELLWVKSIDRSAQTATVSAYGRGYRSTTPAAHTAGTPVLNSPRYARCRVKAAINDAIDGVYPDLFVIKRTNIPYVAARLAYELPEDCEQIHSASYQTIGPSKVWVPINQYRFDPSADTEEFPSGKSVDLWESIIPGRDVRVTYLTSPDLLVNDSDEFSTTTGLASTAEEAVIYGACHRLIGFLEGPRLQTGAVEASARSQLVPPGASVNAAKFFYGLYLEALNKERERLLRLHGTLVHRTRRLM